MFSKYPKLLEKFAGPEMVRRSTRNFENIGNLEAHWFIFFYDINMILMPWEIPLHSFVTNIF